MALHYIYSDAPLSTIDITDRCRVPGLSVKEQAEEGAVPISSLVIDDPDGDFIPVGHRRLHIYEDTAPVDNQHVFNGFVANERVARGPSGRTGASRQWTVDLADPDVLINRRIMNGTDANRPAENDLARIQALLTMTELNTVDDDTYVNTTAATVLMDAVDYRGQNVGAYIDDCRQASGKNAFIFYNEPLGEFGLWYDFATSTEYDSGILLTTDESQEVDFVTTFAVSQERTYLNNDPSRIASGIYLEFDGPGSPVYVQDATTIATFAAIDWPAPSLNVKSLAKATARANRYLLGAKTEDPVIHTVMTKVPRDKVNVVLKGQLVQFKSQWMPGYEAYTTCRVLYRTVAEITEDPTASFEIEMDLSPIPELCPDATAAGYYPPLGGPGPLGGSIANDTPADGVIQYFKAGEFIYQPPSNAAGHAHNVWHFPTYSMADAGSPAGFSDWAPINLGNAIYLYLTGDGTLEILTTEATSNPSWMDIRQKDADPLAVPPGLSWDPFGTDLVLGATAESVTLSIVSLHPEFPCSHLIVIDISGTTVPGGRQFRGINWIPAA